MPKRVKKSAKRKPSTDPNLRIHQMRAEQMAKADLFDYIEVFYNQRRRHSAAGRMSPAAYQRRLTQAA